MDIAGLSTVMTHSQVKQQASLSVMKSALNTAENQGDALVDMLNQSTEQQAPHPHLGGKIDLKG